MSMEHGTAGSERGVSAPREQEIPFPEELAFLTRLKGKLEEALNQAEARVGQIDREYLDEKRYMARYRGEIDPHEMFQNELALKQIDGSVAFAVKLRSQLARMKDSPYFARVDFREAQQRKEAAYYIGPFAFRHQGELLICDWRSPVAGLFYDSEVGPAGYDAPVGRVEGELKRKRQFKIKDGTMEYALETSSSVRDDVLQRELSHTSDEKMKSIIGTIQKEQNQIIRNEKAGTLLIQGVAGSGKTSVALHRIAYLLYRFKERLSAQRVCILSPNRVFSDYISNVLPELGEEPICEWSFEELAQAQLDGKVGFAPDAPSSDRGDEGWEMRVRFKSDLAFVRLLDRYLEQMPRVVFQPADYTYGPFTATAQQIQSRYDGYGKYPVKRRLQMMAEDLHQRFAAEPFQDEAAPAARTICRGLNGMLRVKDTLKLYRAFYQQLGASDMFVMMDKRTLAWDDVSPYLYVQAAFEGVKESRIIRHLVVDEMQDYTPIQYAVLNLLFPCQKTILGDFGQQVDPNKRHTLEDLRSLYPGAEYVELNKSYRSTYEIIQYARGIQNVTDMEPVARHGPAPCVFGCADRQEELERLDGILHAFENSGYASLGVIAKTDREARELFDALSQRHTVNLLTGGSSRFSNGVSIACVQMSKGLEFDEVVITGADWDAYRTEADRGLLYVACTRALHRLSVTYRKKPSALLPVPVS